MDLQEALNCSFKKSQKVMDTIGIQFQLEIKNPQSDSKKADQHLEKPMFFDSTVIGKRNIVDSPELLNDRVIIIEEETDSAFVDKEGLTMMHRVADEVSGSYVADDNVKKYKNMSGLTGSENVTNLMKMESNNEDNKRHKVGSTGGKMMDTNRHSARSRLEPYSAKVRNHLYRDLSTCNKESLHRVTHVTDSEVGLILDSKALVIGAEKISPNAHQPSVVENLEPGDVDIQETVSKTHGNAAHEDYKTKTAHCSSSKTDGVMSSMVDTSTILELTFENMSLCMENEEEEVVIKGTASLDAVSGDDGQDNKTKLSINVSPATETSFTFENLSLIVTDEGDTEVIIKDVVPDHATLNLDKMSNRSKQQDLVTSSKIVLAPEQSSRSVSIKSNSVQVSICQNVEKMNGVVSILDSSKTVPKQTTDHLKFPSIENPDLQKDNKTKVKNINAGREKKKGGSQPLLSDTNIPFQPLRECNDLTLLAQCKTNNNYLVNRGKAKHLLEESHRANSYQRFKNFTFQRATEEDVKELYGRIPVTLPEDLEEMPICQEDIKDFDLKKSRTVILDRFLHYEK